MARCAHVSELLTFSGKEPETSQECHRLGKGRLFDLNPESFCRQKSYSILPEWLTRPGGFTVIKIQTN